MRDEDLGELLHRSARDLPAVDLVAPSLRKAERIRTRRARVAVAGAAALTAAVIASAAALWGGPQPQSDPAPPAAPPPTVTTKVRTVSLLDLGTGPAPAVDRIDQDWVFHPAEGDGVRLTEPGSIDPFGEPVVVGAVGPVSLHVIGGQYAVTIGADRPIPVMDLPGAEDYRQLRRGPDESVLLPVEPDMILSIARDGQFSTIPARGRVGITATPDHYWGMSRGQIWRLDAGQLKAGWKAMGSGQEAIAVHDADAVWVQGPRCGALRDAESYEVLWRSCDLGGSAPTNTSPDGRYVVVQRSERTLDVLQLRTGLRVLTIDAGRGRVVHPSATSSWSDDQVVLNFDEPAERERLVANVTCDVSQAQCWQVELPAGTRWIGPPSQG